MEILLGVGIAVLMLLFLFNTMLLIGIAGSLAKLIKYFNGEEKSDRERWAKIIRDRRILHMQEANQATYADTVGFQQYARNHRELEPRNWDGIPRRPNWDGIPKSEEEEDE